MCGVYLGIFQEGSWIYSFDSMYGLIDDESNNCKKVLEKNYPEFADQYCISDIE